MTTTITTTERRRVWWPGIRARIVIGYVALLAAALAISILVTRQVLVGRLDRDIDQALAQEVEELRSLADGTDPSTGEPFGPDAAAIFDTFLRRKVPGTNEAFYTLVDGQRFLSSFDAPQSVWLDDEVVDRWRSAVEPRLETVRTAAGEMRYLVAPLRDGDGVAGVFVVAQFPEADREEIFVVVRVLLAAGIIVLAASAALAWSLAGRVLRPVRDLTATARQISEDDLTRRIPVEGRDELTELGSTFNDMVDRLEHGFTQQRQFLDDVAHELRTPITIVQGHLEFIDGDDPVDRQESAAVMADELDRMNRYVDELMLLAKAEQGDFLQFGPIDLEELATTLEQRARGLGDRVWCIEAAPPPGGVAIVGDRDRLLQALLNLVTNALQHTADGDSIWIGVDADLGAEAPVAHLWVRDSGPGVDPATIEHLFTRRYRGGGSRAGRSEGMGIGLSIVDAIARGHGGRATAENVPTGGARFTITVPVEPPEEVVP